MFLLLMYYMYFIAHGVWVTVIKALASGYKGFNHVFFSFLLVLVCSFLFCLFVFTSSSLTYLEFILVYGVRCWADFLFFKVTTSLSQHYLFKNSSFFFSLIWDVTISDTKFNIYNWVFSSTFFCTLIWLMCKYHTFFKFLLLC